MARKDDSIYKFYLSTRGKRFIHLEDAVKDSRENCGEETEKKKDLTEEEIRSQAERAQRRKRRLANKDSDYNLSMLVREKLVFNRMKEMRKRVKEMKREMKMMNLKKEIIKLETQIMKRDEKKIKMWLEMMKRKKEMKREKEMKMMET